MNARVRPVYGISSARVAGRGNGGPGPGTVWVDPQHRTIVEVTPDGAPPQGSDDRARRVDLGDRLLAPGFVDVHVHGAMGHQVNGGSPDEVEESLATISRFHVRHGTTALLATTVSDSPARLLAAVEGVARAVRATRTRAVRATRTRAVRATRTPAGPADDASIGARVIGTHLEGPFISPTRAGAHDPSAIRNPDRAELARLLEVGEGTVRLVTIAPEAPGAEALVADCLAAGAAVSLGHTEADYDTARRAFDAGATHVTHLFDAMTPLRHRSPGLVTAALTDRRVTFEVICDLHHVHPAVITLAARAGSGRLVLVTDASPAAGLPPGRIQLGRVPVVLDGTRVALASDASTLAGSALDMGTAVANAVSGAQMPLASALASATEIPARVAWGRGSSGSRVAAPTGGRIAAGALADLVVLGPSLEVVATIVGGHVAFDPQGLFV